MDVGKLHFNCSVPNMPGCFSESAGKAVDEAPGGQFAVAGRPGDTMTVRGDLALSYFRLL